MSRSHFGIQNRTSFHRGEITCFVEVAALAALVSGTTGGASGEFSTGAYAASAASVFVQTKCVKAKARVRKDTMPRKRRGAIN